MAYRQTPEVEARLQDNRSRIPQAARALVSEGGWTEAQVASVAAAAGIATGTVYRYFPSKAELFAEVLALVSQRGWTCWPPSPGGRRRHRAAALGGGDLRQARHAQSRLAYALIAEPCDKEIDEVRLTYRAAISETIRAIVAEGRPPARCAPTCGRTSPPP